MELIRYNNLSRIRREHERNKHRDAIAGLHEVAVGSRVLR